MKANQQPADGSQMDNLVNIDGDRQPAIFVDCHQRDWMIKAADRILTMSAQTKIDPALPDRHYQQAVVSVELQDYQSPDFLASLDLSEFEPADAGALGEMTIIKPQDQYAEQANWTHQLLYDFPACQLSFDVRFWKSAMALELAGDFNQYQPPVTIAQACQPPFQLLASQAQIINDELTATSNYLLICQGSKFSQQLAKLSLVN